MRIHGNQTNLNAVNPYAAAAEKAAATQRAATVRKKLLKNAGNTQNIPSFGETLTLSHWMEPGQSNAHEEVVYRASTAGKDSDFG